jgi:hypothetical protein
MNWVSPLLADFLLPIFAAFLGSWLWAKYDASDFAARRSVASTQKRIKKLEQRLRFFEYMLEDTKRFLAMIIRRGVIVIAFLLFMAMYLLSTRIDSLLITSLPNSAIQDRFGVQLLQVLDLIIEVVTAFAFSQNFLTLADECLPEVYKRKLSERIARLRSRLPA